MVSLISNFDEVFDTEEFESITLKFETYLLEPQVKMEPGLVKTKSKLKFSIMNPESPEEPAAFWTCDTNVTIRLSVLEDAAEITGNIENMTMVVDEFKAFI